MLKVAIIGTGSIAGSHLSAIKKTGACELCAVCDINEVLSFRTGNHRQA